MSTTTPGLDALKYSCEQRPFAGLAATLFLLVGSLGYQAAARILGVEIETLELARRESAQL